MKRNKVSSELIKIQYQEGVSTYRTQISLLIQIMTVLVVGDITIIGFAFENKSASLLIIGAIFPATLLIIIKVIKRLMIPIIETCYRIENEYLTKETPRLATSYIEKTQLSKRPADFFKLRFTETRIYTYIVIVITIGQIASGIIFSIIFKWSIF